MSFSGTESVSDIESTCTSVSSANDENEDDQLNGAKPFLFEPEASGDSSTDSENDPDSPEPSRLGNTTWWVKKHQNLTTFWLGVLVVIVYQCLLLVNVFAAVKPVPL